MKRRDGERAKEGLMEGLREEMLRWVEASC